MVTVDLKTKDKKGQTKIEKYRYQVKKLPDIVKVGEEYMNDWKVRGLGFSLRTYADTDEVIVK